MGFYKCTFVQSLASGCLLISYFFIYFFGKKNKIYFIPRKGGSCIHVSIYIYLLLWLILQDGEVRGQESGDSGEKGNHTR